MRRIFNRHLNPGQQMSERWRTLFSDCQAQSSPPYIEMVGYTILLSIPVLAEHDNYFKRNELNIIKAMS